MYASRSQLAAFLQFKFNNPVACPLLRTDVINEVIVLNLLLLDGPVHFHHEASADLTRKVSRTRRRLLDNILDRIRVCVIRLVNGGLLSYLRGRFRMLVLVLNI